MSCIYKNTPKQNRLADIYTVVRIYIYIIQEPIDPQDSWPTDTSVMKGLGVVRNTSPAELWAVNMHV